MRKSYEFESSESNGPPQGFGSPTPKNSRPRISAGAPTRHAASRSACMLALVSVAVAVFVRIVHRAGATAEYNNSSDELLHGTTIIRGPGKVHGGAGGGGSGRRNEGAAVGDSPPFVPVSQSWLHRRCAHRGGRERRRLLFRPGALFTPEGTAKYISLHLSYRRPGVQPQPVRLSSTLAPAK